eukprot:scaffold17862_cov122-Skeletonema_dohrnii-CCMP3373.AAC.7
MQELVHSSDISDYYLHYVVCDGKMSPLWLCLSLNLLLTACWCDGLATLLYGILFMATAAGRCGAWAGGGWGSPIVSMG